MTRLLLFVAVTISLSGCFSSGDGARRPIPADEARRDPLNPAVWVEGGTVVTGNDAWNLDENHHSSPYSTLDEDPGVWSLAGFWIQEHEVTNLEYARFDPEHSYGPSLADHPVTSVTFGQAMAYARYLGGTLPTEVHWEFAARGPERREYPWGDSPPSCDLAHYRDCEPMSTVSAKARTGDVTPHGVYDLAGNVREWVTPIWYDPTRHGENIEIRRMKGGSFAHPSFFLRGAAVTNNFRRNEQWEYVGFRVAWIGSTAE